MWQELLQAGGPDRVPPPVLRELGIYGGASGVWYDRARTGEAHPPGVTVGVLHTGRHYADDLSDDRILYHYPRTNRPATRDQGEIAATKAAATLELPVFVIRTSAPPSLRDVRRGRIVGHDDSLEIFNIELESPFAGSSRAATAIPRADRNHALPYRRADEASASMPRDPFTIDPDKIDRGLQGHARTQNALADWLLAQEIGPESPGGSPNFDLAWLVGTTRFVAEVKSLTNANVTQQLRLGLGQVLDYSEILASTARVVVPVLVVEYEPPDDRWHRLCDRLGVVLVWPGSFDRLATRFVVAAN
jgi:hypothetical protein